MSRPIARVLLAWLSVSAGQWTFMVATAVFAYTVSGAGGTSAVTVARLLPAMLAAPLAGALIDRVSRTRVVTASCSLQATVIAVAAAVALGHGALLVLVTTMVLASAVGTPCRPALQSVLPALARTPDELTRATAAWSAVDSVGFLAGAGGGGLAIAFLGTGRVMIVAAALLALGALMSAWLPPVTATPADDESTDRSVLSGLRAIRDTRVLHAPIVLFVGLLVLEGAGDVLLTALAIDRLRLGNGGPGLLYAFWGIGGVLGSGALIALVHRRGYGLALFVGALAYAGLLAACGFGGAVVAIAAMVGVGAGFSLVEYSVMGIVPRLADDAVVGRVYGVTELLYAGVSATGAAAAPALVAWFGVSGGLFAVGVAFAAVALCTWQACARLDVDEHTAARVRGLLRGISFLAVLPLPRLERLVRSAVPVEAAAGATIIRAGDVGEHFYVIDRGRVDIVEFGRQQGAGDGFGEIALLHDIARTATVRAASNTALWSIDRQSFLAAVGAHEDVARAARATAKSHLARPRIDGTA